jgi:hypothetical protein
MDTIIGWAVFIGICYVLYQVSRSKLRKRARLKSEYEEALRGRDKAKALAAGRAYYQEMRDGKNLTIYDEQAIANDLSTMNI